MERFTISLDDELAHEFDRLIAERGYRNRSEAVRDLLRSQLESFRFKAEEAEFCIANLSYVYNHHERTLSERLMHLQHNHHDLTVSTMHAHLDHADCIESVFLRGPTAEVRAFADAMTAESGVRHGQLNMISLTVDEVAHSHPHPHDHPHGKEAKAGNNIYRHTHLKTRS